MDFCTMSSQLTGWQSQQNVGLDDICGLETTLPIYAKCKSLNISRSRTPRINKQSKKRKYLLPSKNNSTYGHPSIQKKKINIVAFNPYFKKFKSKIAEQAKLHGNFLRQKQNIEKQLTKKSMQMRNKIIKPHSDVKLSVVNVFERLDFHKPEPEKEFEVMRLKQKSLHKIDTKKPKYSKIQEKQLSRQTIIQNSSKISPQKFKYINLTSFQVIYNQKHGYKLSRLQNLHKFASSGYIRKYK